MSLYVYLALAQIFMLGCLNTTAMKIMNIPIRVRKWCPTEVLDTSLQSVLQRRVKVLALNK